MGWIGCFLFHFTQQLVHKRAAEEQAPRVPEPKSRHPGAPGAWDPEPESFAVISFDTKDQIIAR